jgi:hypothetical protein
MDADHALEQAVHEWRQKYHVADADPMLTSLELVRIYLQHAPRIEPISELSPPPSYAEFRAMIGSLSTSARLFAEESKALLHELRLSRSRARQSVEVPPLALLMIVILSLFLGATLLFMFL